MSESVVDALARALSYLEPVRTWDGDMGEGERNAWRQHARRLLGVIPPLLADLPEESASKSRDFGRGYSQCLRDVIERLSL